MSKLEKVIKGLEECSKADFNPCMERVCPYAPKNTNNFCDCRIHLLIDALELLKAQRETIDELISADKLLKEQDDLETELTNAVELIHKKNERIEKLLKEQKGLMLALEQSNAVNGFLNAEVERMNGLLKEQENDIHHMGLIIDEYEKELKKQEAVDPIPPTDESDLWRCGNCNHQLFRCTHQRYCEMCGRQVKWE